MSLGQLTTTQTMVIVTLFENGSVQGADVQSMLSLDELITNVPYTVSKASIQFTLRRLRQRGFVQKSEDLVLKEVDSKNKQRRLWFLTENCRQMLARA
jgi:hypothetical protein